MSGIRLIVSDLDGTLLSESGEVTDPVREAVRRFRAAGGMFTIATGRIAASAMKYAEALALDAPCILCNGSVIADRREVLESAVLPLVEIAPFLEEADERGIAVLLFPLGGGIRVLRRTEEVLKFERKESVVCGFVDARTAEWKRQTVQKVLQIGDMRRIRDAWDKHRDRLRELCSTVQSEEDYFEIIPPNQSKGKALIKLMERLRVEPSEVMAIGNQLNDLDMIVHAGIGVAVRNSHPDLIRTADYVCAGAYGDGVVEAMERFCKLEK